MASSSLVETVVGVRRRDGVRPPLSAITIAVVAAAAAFLVAGCTAGTAHPAASTAPGVPAVPLPPDPRTPAALLAIAAVFNNEYDSGDYGPVYARWDARSQAIITGAEYIRRHKECPSAPQTAAQVESATPGPHGAWIVDYEIGGQRLTDYWFYVHRRWVFDLVLSNPGSVRLYRMSPRQYVAAVGCSH
jgi:hypothetical protein